MMCADQGRFVLAQRQHYRCALPGFSRSLWSQNDHRSFYMGRLPDPEDQLNPQEPPESLEEGCPGAWYRCAFVRSLLPYERTSSTDGVLNENLRLTRCTDPLVLDAIQYLETERTRARNHDNRKMMASR